MLILDVQGAQSVDHRDRGIAAYVLELARGLERVAPGTVDAYTYNPDLALPGGIEPLVASGRFVAADEVEYPPGTVLHVASPIELAVPFDRVVPRAALDSGAAIVATVFDLIPEVFAQHYLVQPGIRRRYRTRLELLRRADHLVAISRSTADDVERILGRRGDDVTVVELAAADRFTPAADHKAAAARARDLVPGLRDRFVLYTGGQDMRKNVERLVEVWASMGGKRGGRQLVVACKLEPLARNHIEVRGRQLGLADDGLLITGWVPEDALVALNQSAELAVFPSIYEGFGFPVAEALACRTPVVSSNRSSLPELLPAEACFDPDDTGAMVDAISRGLRDDALRRAVVEGHVRRTVLDVARDTAAVYERVAGRHRRPPRSKRARRRVAFVSPLPPVPGGVSDFSHRILERLRELADVDAFVDGPPHHRDEIVAARAPDGVAVRPLAAMATHEAFGGRYDDVVWTLGNSEYHTGALDGLLRERRGVVLAHEVRLTGLYRFARWQHPGATPGGFQATLHRSYPGKLPPDLGDDEHLDPADAERFGVFMAADAIAASDRFLVTSEFAARLARLDARGHDRHKVEAIPFAVGAVAGDPWPSRGTEDDRPLVVSFGGISALKQTALLIDAFAIASGAHRTARLVFVGAVNDEVQREVDAAASRAGVADRVDVTGGVSTEQYKAWLGRAWVAVQLRATTNGESSGAAGDCFAAGVPTIVSAIGAARDIPADAAIGVPADVPATQLGDTIAALLRDGARRATLSKGALAHAARHTYAKAAEALYERLSARSSR